MFNYKTVAVLGAVLAAAYAALIIAGLWLLVPADILRRGKQNRERK
jgi:hypothetical protein